MIGAALSSEIFWCRQVGKRLWNSGTGSSSRESHFATHVHLLHFFHNARMVKPGSATGHLRSCVESGGELPRAAPDWPVYRREKRDPKCRDRYAGAGTSLHAQPTSPPDPVPSQPEPSR